MPLPFTDRLGHPVAILSLREVIRDDDGSLAEIKDWTWWGLELVRRVIRDWWIDGRRGTGSEGIVLLIDVKGAGYRNLVSYIAVHPYFAATVSLDNTVHRVPISWRSIPSSMHIARRRNVIARTSSIAMMAKEG